MATQLTGSILIVDDRKARKFATALGVNITGTVGVILEAKFSGIIPSVKPVLKKIKSTNFRISAGLESLILEKAGEKSSN